MNEEFAANIRKYNIEWSFYKFSIEANLFTRLNQELKIKNQENCYVPEENLEKITNSVENVESFEPLDTDAENGDELTLPYLTVGFLWDLAKIISENFVLVGWINPWICEEIFLTRTRVMEVNPNAIPVYGLKKLRLEEFKGGGSSTYCSKAGYNWI